MDTFFESILPRCPEAYGPITSTITDTLAVGFMTQRPYQLSPLLIILCGGFVAFMFVFFALPYVALVAQEPSVEPPPFTVSVDPKNKVIVSTDDNLASAASRILAVALRRIDDATVQVATAIMATKVYSNFAPVAPQSITILPGMREEQVVVTFAHALGWSRDQKQIFIDMAETEGNEGKFYPGTYIVHASTTPAEAYEVIQRRFEERILARYTPEVEEVVPLVDALVLASIVEREAGTIDEMRVISGIFWNRLFAGTRLQADSTLQYARGTSHNGWWPVPRSRDKYLTSPHNTYLHEGLPPTPIASPSVAAIMAALNPTKTDCFFFFHAKQKFYCSVTYEEHVQKLKSIYGRGR